MAAPALTRSRLVEVIRDAYVPGPDLDADGPVCACCWGVTCPEHAAEAVLNLIESNCSETNGDAS